MSDSTINGIPRVDPRAGRAAWKRGLARLTSTKPGAAVHRTIAAPLDAAVMKITGGRANLAVGAMPWWCWPRPERAAANGVKFRSDISPTATT